jgi:hypothetical protein
MIFETVILETFRFIRKHWVGVGIALLLLLFVDAVIALVGSFKVVNWAWGSPLLSGIAAVTVGAILPPGFQAFPFLGWILLMIRKLWVSMKPKTVDLGKAST